MPYLKQLLSASSRTTEVGILPFGILSHALPQAAAVCEEGLPEVGILPFGILSHALPQAAAVCQEGLPEAGILP